MIPEYDGQHFKKDRWNQEKQKVAHAPANDPSGYVNCGLNPAYEHGDLLPVEQQRVVV